MWCGVRRVSSTPHRSGDAVSPLAATATCRRAAALANLDSRHQRWMSRGCPINASSRVGFRVLPRCLPPCMPVSTLSLRPAIRTHTFHKPPTPTQTDTKEKKTRRARERLALGFIPFLYALSFEDAVYFPPRCSLSLFSSSVFGLRRPVFFGKTKFLLLALTPSHSFLIASAVSLGFFRAFTVITICTFRA